MIPILYSASETAFTNNGLGFLADATACTVEHEINGQFELAMTYPISGERYADLEKNTIILADADPYAKAQPFRIYRITKPLNGLVKIYARHVAYDMQGIPTAPAFAASSAAEAVAALGTKAVVDCPFTFETDISTAAAMSVIEPKDIWTLMGDSGGLLSVYGGEWEFDRFAARLKTRLGEDRGVVLRYGWNLTSMEQDDNCDSVYTGVYPYWKKDETVVTLDEKTLSAEGTFEKAKILPLDLSSYFSAEPTQDELRTAAESYMTANEIGVPQISWTVGYVQLSKTAEYKDSPIMEDIGLGDSVTVIFPKMGINATSRVVKIQYNVLLNRCDSISIGSVKKTISDTIAEQSAAISSLGGGVASAQADIEKLGDEYGDLYDEVQLKASITGLNAAIEKIGTVEAGLDAAVTALGYNEETGQYEKIEAWTNLESVVGDSSSGLVLDVTRVQTAQKTTETSVAELTTRVGTVESGLSTKADTSTLDGYLTKTAAAELYATDDDVTTLIGAYIAVDEAGNKKSLAQIVADIVSIQGDINVEGKLTVNGDYVWSNSPVWVNNNIYCKKISANEISYSGTDFTSTDITSTTGTEYTVLGAA